MDLDQKALNLIYEWEQSQEYKNESQRKAALQIILASALGEQQELVKLACCEAVKQCEKVDVSGERVRRREAMGACLTVEI